MENRIKRQGPLEVVKEEETNPYHLQMALANVFDNSFIEI